MFKAVTGAFQYVQIGLTHGAVAECFGDAFPGIFVRIDNADVLKFIQNSIQSKQGKSKGRIFLQFHH